jgi:amidophosphoribosyltransferase
MKFNPLKENVAGRRLVVLDDSVVRGTTQKQLVKMLREAGALEVHLRLTSPPVRWPCFYGMDFGDTKQLLAANLDVEGIRAYLGVDTLAYIDLDRLLTSTGADPDSFCSACFTGEYPLPIPDDLAKGMLETDGRLAIDRDSSRSASAVMFEASLLPADDVRRDARAPAPEPAGPGGPVEI